MSTGLSQIDSPLGRFQLLTAPPQTPAAYYGALYGIAIDSWQGGEVFYHNGVGTGGNKLYIQTATSGTTPTWKVVSTQFEDYP